LVLGKLLALADAGLWSSVHAGSGVLSSSLTCHNPNVFTKYFEVCLFLE